MADIADVSDALTSAIWNAIYPNGPSTTPANGYATKVFAGWPVSADLDADVIASPPVINVSIFSQTGLERNVSRYPREWVDQTRVAPTIAAAVAGSTVTLSGTITAGNYVSIIAFNKAFSYAALVSDTLATVAAALAALINAAMPAYSAGPAITIIGRSDIIARTAAPGTLIQELERSNQRFIVTIWAPDNDARVATARVIRPALAAIDFLDLADTSRGRLIYEASTDVDRQNKQNVSCRDIFYWVEYPTTQVMPGYPITIDAQQITTADGTPGGSIYDQYN